MNPFRLVVIGCVLVLGLALAPAGASAVAEVMSLSDEDQDDNRSMGAELNSFMHSSSASANGSVEQGMFEATFDDVEDPEAAVTNRTGQLEAKYDRLEAQYEALEDSDRPAPARDAQLTRIAVQLDNLDRSAAATEGHGHEHGVDTERLAVLRQNASDLSGPEVAEIAQSLAGVNPPGLENGPPGQENGPPGQENESDDRSPPDRNESDDTGPPGQDGDEGGDNADETGEEDDDSDTDEDGESSEADDTERGDADDGGP